MKCKALFILFILPLCSVAQNLVPNGSFEEYEECPDGLGTVSCNGWYSVLNSCDNFNSCSTLVGVPDNPQSYQSAFDGDGYCGFHTYALNNPEYREILGVKLMESLEIGATYYFSFQINKADKTENIKATNNVGIKFSMDSIQTEAELINNTAHFKIDSICYDSENWNLITGSFVADAEYEYLFMGNFFNDANTQTDGPGTVWDRNGYYNVEDVRVSANQAFAWPVSVREYLQIMPKVTYNASNQQLLVSVVNSSLEIVIYDVTGKLLKNVSITEARHQTDVSNFSLGLYLVVLKDEKMAIKTYRFIKL